jgi:hypothetical protein
MGTRRNSSILLTRLKELLWSRMMLFSVVVGFLFFFGSLLVAATVVEILNLPLAGLPFVTIAVFLTSRVASAYLARPSRISSFGVILGAAVATLLYVTIPLLLIFLSQWRILQVPFPI